MQPEIWFKSESHWSKNKERRKPSVTDIDAVPQIRFVQILSHTRLCFVLLLAEWLSYFLVLGFSLPDHPGPSEGVSVKGGSEGLNTVCLSRYLQEGRELSGNGVPVCWFDVVSFPWWGLWRWWWQGNLTSCETAVATWCWSQCISDDCLHGCVRHTYKWFLLEINCLL